HIASSRFFRDTREFCVDTPKTNESRHDEKTHVPLTSLGVATTLRHSLPPGSAPQNQSPPTVLILFAFHTLFLSEVRKVLHPRKVDSVANSTDGELQNL